MARGVMPVRFASDTREIPCRAASARHVSRVMWFLMCETVRRYRTGVKPLSRGICLTRLGRRHNVVHPRNTPSTGETDREMAIAGSRFETYVRAAMKEADDMSLAELARASGVKETNWHGWFRGEHKPRRNTMSLAGRALRRTPDQLLAVWEGERPQKRRGATETPDALVMALRDQTAAIGSLVAKLDEFLDTRRRADAAESALLELQGSAERPERHAPRGTRG